MVDLKKSLENPYHCYDVNCFGTLNMLELGLKKNVKRFVFGSSANVYGAPKSLSVVEDSPYNPRAPYDYSKVIGETLAMSYYRNKMLPVSITRSWLIFGENDAPNRAIPRFINACLKNEPIQLFNAGRDTTAPSHVMNYTKLVKLILDDKVAVGEAFNFGGERVLSIRELAELIKRIAGSRSELIMLPPRTQLEAEPQVSYPSTDKIRKKLGYIYELNVEEGLKRTIQSMKLTS
jgi:nucleoside-diphosphate-sugar epimerase